MTKRDCGCTHRAERDGYRHHDHFTDWQECDTCGIRLGRGISTPYDAEYYAGDPSVCPACDDGIMALPTEEPR